jgi:hypothetical protein
VVAKVGGRARLLIEGLKHTCMSALELQLHKLPLTRLSGLYPVRD